MLFIIIIILILIYILIKNIKVSKFIKDIDEFNKTIETLGNEYIPHSYIEQLKVKYEYLYKKMEHQFVLLNTKVNNFLKIYNNLETKIDEINNLFIDKELKRTESFFNDINGYSLDKQQRLAVITEDDNNIIVAGAGTGKTLTMTAKIKYLLEEKKIEPNSILAISFTNYAVESLKSKNNNEKLDIFTFHRLGKYIIEENQHEKISLAEDKKLNEIITNYFNNEIIKDETKLEKVITFFSCYLNIPSSIDDIKAIGEIYDIEKGKDFHTIKDKVKMYKKRKYNQEKETIKGEVVKSVEELIIANFLYLNGIEYEYESEYKGIIKDSNTIYRPDFYLKDYDIYLEHFGVNKEIKLPWLSKLEENKYLGSIEWKRNIHLQNNTKLLETYSYYATDGTIIDKLRQLMLDNNIAIKKQNYKEIYDAILNDGEYGYLKEFNKLLATFVNLFKSNNYNSSQFKEFKNINNNISSSFLKQRNNLFLSIVEDIYMDYELYLKSNSLIDFNDMINQSITIVTNGGKIKEYKYIIVDEYQDTSFARYSLIKAIRKRTNAKLIVVGDDWQSIYRFTGCDIDMFIDFNKYYGYAKMLKIEQTYRNSKELINVAGNFVMKNKRQIIKELKSNKTISKPIEIYYYKNDIGGAFENVVNKIIETNSKDIYVIGRNKKDINKIILNNNNFWMAGDKIKYKHHNINIKYLTVHKSKGLESENVILINLENDLIGFPNKISDDPVLSFVLNGDNSYPYEEERRLFYVALTRTQNKVYLLVPINKESIFVSELKNDYKDNIVISTHESVELDNPLCPRCKTGKLVIRKKDSREFLGCSNYPRCSLTYKNIEILNNQIKCPNCGSYLVKRMGKFGVFYGCINYPNCKYTIDTNKKKEY